MKTSKRLLSIVLMLAMLVSMFTVMAFARGNDASSATVDVDLTIGANGKVTVDGRNYRTSGTYTFAENALLEAVPDAGYTAKWWLVNGDEIFEYGAQSQLSLASIGRGFGLKVTFEEAGEEPEPATGKYKVTVDVKKISGSTPGSVLYKGKETTKITKLAKGEEIELTAVPTDSTYTFEKWTVSGIDITRAEAANNVLTFTMPAGNVSVTAVFTKSESAADERTLNVSVGRHGELTVDGFAATKESYSLKDGDQMTFTAYADSDYTVVWELNGKTTNTKKSSAEIKVSYDDLRKSGSTLTVTFTPVEPVVEEYRLTANVEKIGSKYPGYVKYDSTEDTSVRVNVEKGDTVTLRATAKTGYKFYKWVSDDITISSSDAKNSKLVLTMPGRDVKVTATFKEDSSYTGDYTLKVRVSGSGDVTCGGKDVKTSYPMGDKDELTFKATATKSNYEVRWCIDDGKWHYTGKSKANITIDASDMDYDDATLYIEFVKEGSSTPSTKSYTLTVDISGSKYGKVTSKNSKVSDGDTFSLEKNETRTFKAEPDSGYLAVWTFGTEVYVGSSYTVKMGSKNATLYVDFVDKDSYRWGDLPFHDVSNRNWYYDDVVYAYINGLMDGISMTEFGANQNTTRGQVVTILWRLTGEPRVTKSNSFTDVSSKSYYNTAISWAAENGIVNGYDAKTFRPDAYVTREQLAAILYRYADYMNLSLKGASNLMKFDDYYSIGAWARDSLAWANYHGLINGVDSYHIDPKGNTTRAQLAAILHRFAVEFG